MPASASQLSAAFVRCLALTILGLSAAAGAAHAQAVELIDESTSAHCIPATCQFNVQSDSPVVIEAFGSTLSACDMSFDMSLNEDGYGTATNLSATGPDCTTPFCDPPILYVEHIREGWLGGESKEWDLCHESSTLGEFTCNLTAIEIDSSTHLLAFHASASPCENLGFVHYTGSWSTDSSIEIQHL